MTTPLIASSRHLRKHWDMLVNQIGNRECGSENEQRAADYIEGQFRRFGLSDVHQHRFEFPNSRCTKYQIKVRQGSRGKWKVVANIAPFAYSVSTPPEGITAPLVYLEDGNELHFKQDLRGKIGLLVGSLSLVNERLKERLRRSKLSAMLAVDSRIPHAWRIPGGAAPQWMQNYDLPTVCVPFLEATNLLRQMPLQAKITVKASTFPDTSQNVIGEVVGTKHPDQVIIVSGHHDTVWGNAGADDNGSGVVFTLEMARIFAKSRPRRTIRFVTYGVEERLSVGSYLYMRSLTPKERKAFVLVLNADGIAGRLGPDEVHVTGDSKLQNLVTEHWHRCGHPASVERSVTPYSDHFPINICGAPAIRLYRPGCMWTLHSEHDNLENVSSEVIRRTIGTSANLLQRIANAPRLPFAAKLVADVHREVQAAAKKYFHHPWSPDQFRYR